MGIIIKNLDEFLKDCGLIMDFWNDNSTFVTLKKNVDSKKCQSSVKIKLKNKTSSNENFNNEVHWNFFNIYKF
jgi:hypothetical protein